MMLSLHKLRRLSPHLRRHARPTDRRSFVTGLGAEFLDLALALPIPPSWPIYSTSIILVTLATRFAILPVTIWAKRKSRIVEEVVMPEIEQQAPAIAQQVFKQMQADKITGKKPFLIEYHQKKFQEAVSAQRSVLLKKHGCQHWKTIVVPTVVQLPPFIGITLVLRQLSEFPTPFDSESFLTLSTLVHPDPTMVLPIVLGIVTMANVETSSWLMTTTQRVKLRHIEKKREQMRVEGKTVIEPGNIVKSTLRGLSVFRILLASVMPGSVTLFWVTSASFGLVQTLIMDWMDMRRRQALEALQPVETPVVLPRKGLPKGTNPRTGKPGAKST